MVDARDLKSLGACPCTSSILVLGTIEMKGLAIFGNPFFRDPKGLEVKTSATRILEYPKQFHPVRG